MGNTFQRITQSTFLRHNAVFFLGSVGVGVLNYLYYPVLGRLMEPAAFGEIQTLVSIFLQFTVFMQVLNMVVVNVVVNYKDKVRANQTILDLEKVAVLLALGFVLLSIVLGPLLRNALQFDSATPFVALALAILVSVPLSFRTGYIRAKHKFGTTSTALGLGAAGKIVFSALLVAIGLSTLGAILGIVAAQLIAFVYAATWALRLGFARPGGTKYAAKIQLKPLLPELSYASAILISSLSVMLLMSIDMLAVKYYFPPDIAGQYAGIATVARAIFFFTASIALVLLPHVKLSNPPAQNRALLLKSAALLVGTGGSALLVCVLAPESIINMLMGGDYLEYAWLLPRLALTVFVISALNLLFTYFLAMRVKMVMLIGIMGFVTALVALVVHHGSLREVVDSVLTGSIVTMCLLGIFITLNTLRPRANQKRYDPAATRIGQKADQR